MISRKKRTRYINNAKIIAEQNNLSINLDSWEEIWNLLDKYSEPTYLYCIKGAGLEYKFGKSINPWQRMSTLQTGYAYPLTMVIFIKEDGNLTEKKVHKRLKDHKLKGEWFKWSPEVQLVIDEMRQGS